MDEMSRRASAPLADWFAVVRRLECAFGDHPRIGRSRRAADDAVRFAHPPSLDFAPAAVLGVDALADGRARVRSAALGLWGPNGALPLHLTEYALERRHIYRDDALEAFADVFHHRLLSLFYRAWAEAQPCVQADRPCDDAFDAYFSAIAGVAKGEPLSRVIRSSAARFTVRSRNAEGLRATLTQLLGLPVRVEECVPCWLAADEFSRCRLGRSRLGRDGVLGRVVRDATSGFRLRIGPMSWQHYTALSPGGAGSPALVSTVRRYAGETCHWDARLCLQREQVPEPCLGSHARLGHSFWIGAPSGNHHPDDLVVKPPATRVHDGAKGIIHERH